jgi:DNA segregation ATPase FtsK/SpoIIIE, S-DNA-T family
MRHRRPPWLLRLGLVAALLPVVIILRSVPGPVWSLLASLLLACLRVYLFAARRAVLVLELAAVLVLGRLVLAAVRFARLPAEARRYWLPARWHSLRWRWLCHRLGLAVIDNHQRAIRPVLFGTAAPMPRRQPARDKLRFPRARFTPDPWGFTVRVKTVPGVGRAELDKAALHLADAMRAVRVQVRQDSPGVCQVWARRRDPLAELLPASVLPVFDGRHVVLGRDEWGDIRSADLANLSGSAFSGSPGRGKTEAALSLAVQLAPSPLVDTWIFDGGACDWEAFADGAAGYVGDNLEAAEDMLHVLDSLMGDRRRNLRSVRGSTNGWALGPAEDYRLQWVLMEEAPFYLDLETVKGDRKREDRMRAIRGLLAGLLRRGRAPLFHTTLVAQKGTGSAGLPPDLRDLAGLRWSHGVATTEAAAAILGDDIRQHATMSPTLLQGPEHVGVASVLLRTGTSPYTLLRFPSIGQDRADQAARELADRVLIAPRDSSAPTPAGVP